MKRNDGMIYTTQGGMKQLPRMKMIGNGMDRLRYEVRPRAQYEVSPNTSNGTDMDMRFRADN